jgi:transposase
MRKIHEVLRLHSSGLSKRQIAVSLNIGRTAVREYIDRALRAGLSWPLPEDLTDQDLERLLFPPPSAVAPDRRVCPNWPALHGELKKPGVTLSLTLGGVSGGPSRGLRLQPIWRSLPL